MIQMVHRNKKRPWYIRKIVPIVILVMLIGLIMSIQAWQRHRLIADPLSLSHEYDIQKASQILIKLALSEESPSESIQKLKAIIIKLRDGWDGFVVDRYSPIEFTSQDLLRNVIYWDISNSIAQAKVVNKENILILLHLVRPWPGTDLWASYRYALQIHGLESLLQNDD